MIIYKPHPVLLSFAGFEIRYYGLFYFIGFLIVWFMYKWLASKSKELKEHADKAFEMLFWGLIGGILFARLFYVLFYDFPYYSLHPLESFLIWKGGLSFHGGLFGAVLFVYLFCKKNSIYFLDVADVVVIPIALALAIGRLGNFLNGELVGRVTNVPWAVIFTTDPALLPRHPSQLYESLKNLLIFYILFILFKRYYLKMNYKQRRGLILFSFIFLYGFFRFIVEFFRAPDPQLGLLWLNLSLGQWFSLGMIFSALLFYVFKKRKSHNSFEN